MHQTFIGCDTRDGEIYLYYKDEGGSARREKITPNVLCAVYKRWDISPHLKAQDELLFAARKPDPEPS